jgi:hypothetical protein
MNQIYNFSLEQVVNERIASFMENLILLASESQFAAAEYYIPISTMSCVQYI